MQAPDFQRVAFESEEDEREWYRQYPDLPDSIRNKKLRGYLKCNYDDIERHCEMGAFVDDDELERDVHWHLSTLLPTRKMWDRYLEGWKNNTPTKAQRRYMVAKYRQMVVREKDTSLFNRHAISYLMSQTNFFTANEKALFRYRELYGPISRRTYDEEIPDIFA